MSGRISADVEFKDSDIRRVPSSSHQKDGLPYVYKVGKPAKQDLLSKIKTGLKETFLSDDPLKPFKDNQEIERLSLGFKPFFQYLDGLEIIVSLSSKAILLLDVPLPVYVYLSLGFPIFKEYTTIFAISIFILGVSVPMRIELFPGTKDIGYAKLANLDPRFGLYSSFVPPLIYAFMGSSRDIAIGPVAVVSLLLGTMLRDEFDPVKQKHDYQRLAFTATFFAGVTQFTLGFFRLGFLIDFLSHAAIVGFMGGAAVTIGLQQLKGLFGIRNFTKKTDVVSVMRSVVHSAHHGWNWQTLVIGDSFLAFLLVAKFIGKKNKKLFWVPAIAPLISVIISTFFVYITRADKDGVQIVKHIKKGINPSSVHEIFFTGTYLVKGFKIGVVAGLIALTEAVAIGRTFASMKDYQIDGNKEMVALVSMNIIGSLTSCYVATGSFSRSAVNFMAGCNTAVSNIVMSCIVLLTLFVITPLFKYTPNAILASIIISAVVSLIDFEAAILLWKIDKFDFVACMGAFFGVVFVSVEIGLLIAVGISFAKILLQVTRPRTAVLGKIPRTNVYRNVEQYPGATRVPGVLVVRVDSAIYFSNSNYIKERILRWLRDEGELFKDQPRVQYLIVDLSPVSDIDTSGIHALEELYSSLLKKDVKLIITNPGQTVLEKLHSSDFVDLIGEDKIFLSVADAVQTFAPKMELA